MYFESFEEQERIEKIASKIEYIADKQGYSDFRKCTAKASSEFEEILSNEAWDVITLTAIDLYQRSLAGICRGIQHYKYHKEEKAINYRVTKIENVALFEIE